MEAPSIINAEALALAALLIATLAVLVTSVILVRQRTFLKRYRSLLNGPTGHDLEHLLLQQTDQLMRVVQSLTVLRAEVERMRAEARRYVQGIGAIRFNAFSDTGSDLSFAIALLDGEQNGVVFSSLYGRNESRVYAKPIHKGGSAYILSEEEQQAILHAMNQTETKR